MVDLAALEQEIAEIGTKIRTLKASSGSAEEVSAAVALLVEKKKLYADNNHGIGVDGKPFGAGGAAAATAGSGKSKKDKEDKGPAKQVSARYQESAGLVLCYRDVLFTRHLLFSSSSHLLSLLVADAGVRPELAQRPKEGGQESRQEDPEGRGRCGGSSSCCFWGGSGGITVSSYSECQRQ
jgi:hypothetical protein